MGKLSVQPSGDKWVVERNGATVSNHRLKERAIDRAYNEALRNDTLEIRRLDGTIQETRTVR